MQAIRAVGREPATGVTTQTIPKPNAEGAMILVEVFASGITADELTWPELWETPDHVPGHDISGVVRDLGPAYDGPLSIGDPVFAMLTASGRRGGQAEYVLVAPDEIAKKPSSLSFAQAAALPIPILTAWEAIFTHAQMRKGLSVLVTGASGAVGVMLVQLASRLLDAQVIALASQRKQVYVGSLGAATVLSYDDEKWTEFAKEVDVVFDTVGGTTLSRAWDCIKSDGVIVTVADPPPPWAFGGDEPVELQSRPNVQYKYFVVSHSGEILSKTSVLFDEDKLQPLPIEVFSMDDGIQAWKRAGERDRRGKVILDFS